MNSWTVRLTDQAAQDVEEILEWTLEQFGPLQVDIYTDVINDTLEDLTEGPESLGVRWPLEWGKNVAILHVARNGRKGRHEVVFRVDERTRIIEVLRILHDSMDLARHIPSSKAN
jgi:toxin ParE1/3/4